MLYLSRVKHSLWTSRVHILFLYPNPTGRPRLEEFEVHNFHHSTCLICQAICQAWSKQVGVRVWTNLFFGHIAVVKSSGFDPIAILQSIS